jgi:hypothetical protein
MDALRELTAEVRAHCSAPLELSIKGTVLYPDDPGYDAARTPWNLSFEQHPELIVIPRDADDIAAAVCYALEEELNVAVQATGHGVRTPADDALLIVTSEMTGVEVDPETQTAWVEAGAKWAHVLEAAQAHGLAPLLGSSPDVGAVGYTLGGGLGWLARKYGLAADSAPAFDVVTADGRQLRVSEHEHPDLFWGLRGGGGSLAIVARMQIRLYPVDTVYAGNLLYPVEMAGDVMSRYRDWITTLPDEMTTSIVLLNVPPLPTMPEPLRGKSFAVVRGCYTGDLAAGAALIDDWRAWRAPAIDMFGPLSFSQSAMISQDPEDPSPAVVSGAWLRELDDATLETLMNFTVPQGGPPLIVMTEVRHIGGAVSRGDVGRAAYGNRDAELLLELVSITPTPEIGAAAHAHIAAMKAALGPAIRGAYMNFLEGEEAHERLAEGFSPETLQRLRALKAAWDPENRFCHSFRIDPLP